MPPIYFKTSEALAAYNEIIPCKNDLYKTSAERSLKDIDNLIYFLRERNGELTRKLAACNKRSAWSYLEQPQEERPDFPLTFLKFRPVFIAKILLDHEAEIKERRLTIRSHLLKLDRLIGDLSRANMDLAERIRQKKTEAHNPLSRSHSSEQEQDVEMRIIHPRRQSVAAIPRYQRAIGHVRIPHTPIATATVVDRPPTGVPLTALFTANSSATYSSTSASPPTSPPPSARTAAEILDLAISFDKNA